MSRRRKSSANVKKSKDDTTGGSEWTEEEKSSLSDALKIDGGENNWRWIARQVKTKTMIQVKEFAEKLKKGKRTASARSASHEKQVSNKRPIKPKEDGPLEGWINATKRLRADDDVDGACIPQQNERSRKQEHQESSDKNVFTGRTDRDASDESDNDDKEGSQDPVSNNNLEQHESVLSSDSYSDKEDQLKKIDSFMEGLLTNQKQMMEKLSLLESKLENVRSDEASSRTSVTEILTKINSRLDQLDKSTSHGCCGGPVIIQTTPHASVVHQPVLDSCSSCRGAKQKERHRSSVTVSKEDSIANKERADLIVPRSLIRTPMQSSPDAGNTLMKKNSGDRPPAILILDTQDKSLPKPQAVTSNIHSPEITSHLPNVSSTAESTKSINTCEHSVISVSVTKTTTPVPSRESLPDDNRKQFPRGGACASIMEGSGSFPNGATSIGWIVNQSPTVGTTSNTCTKSPQMELYTGSRRQREPVSEHSNSSFTPSQQRFMPPLRETGVAPIQTTPVSVLKPSYIDLQSTLSTSPVLCTVVKNPASAARPIPVCTLSEARHSPQQTKVVVSSSNAGTTVLKTNSEHCPRIPLHGVTTTSSQTSIPPGYITLSHTTNIPPSPIKIHGTSPLQPQTVKTTTQGKDLHLSPAAGAVIRNTANDASAKQTAASPKEIMNAAVLISNYVREHPNNEYQAEWQSCLSAIVTDYHKSQNRSRGDMLQLVSIGYNPYVVVTQFELEDMLEKSKGRPKFFALRLAEKLFGIDVLVKSTPYGIGGKAALHPAILDAIKVEVLRRFAPNASSEAQTALWKACVTSIAQRCKRARNPRRNRLSRRRFTSDDDDLGPPSMAVGGGNAENSWHCEEHEENDDSHGESDEDDEDYELGGLERPVAKHTPPLVRIPSDDEQETSKSSTRSVVLSIDGRSVSCVTQEKDSSVREESSADSSSKEHEPEGNKQDILPPGIDPDITVVHLPSSLQASAEPQTNQTDQRRSPVRKNSANSMAASCSDCSDLAAEQSAKDEAETVSVQDPSEHESESNPQEKDASEDEKVHEDLLKVAQSIHKLGASTESITVSGIKMTPDYSHVLIGGNPNVAVPRQKYLDALTRSSQPTHFAVRLAEITFGDDVLEASTVTGGKRGTTQLDPIVINAIQIEVTGRFLKDLTPEQQSVVWRKCVTSIATRCKTLRYNRSRTAGNHWTVYPMVGEKQESFCLKSKYKDQSLSCPSPNDLKTKLEFLFQRFISFEPLLITVHVLYKIMTIAAMEPTQSDPGGQTPDYGQIYTLLSRVMREQPPPNLTPLDARVILDLLNDLERRLAGHDISNQVSFVVNKYREIMATTHVEATSTTGGVLPPQQASSSDPNSSASRPKTQLSSLNPLNVPVELLNLKKRTPVNPSSQPPLPERTKEAN